MQNFPPPHKTPSSNSPTHFKKGRTSSYDGNFFIKYSINLFIIKCYFTTSTRNIFVTSHFSPYEAILNQFRIRTSDIFQIYVKPPTVKMSFPSVMSFPCKNAWVHALIK